MLVETFECEETATESPEMCAEAQELIDSLGLTGQKAMTAPATERRIPYRLMTADEKFVYSQLCPLSTALSGYKQSPIPLRVLQVAAHAKQSGFFEKLVVWDRASVASKDPVLVGYEVDRYDAEPYILARWGEHLEEWPALVKQAIATWRQNVKDYANDCIRKSKAYLETIDSLGMSEALRGNPVEREIRGY